MTHEQARVLAALMLSEQGTDAALQIVLLAMKPEELVVLISAATRLADAAENVLLDRVDPGPQDTDPKGT